MNKMLELNKVGKKADWKECLSIEAEHELNQILEAVKRHRCAYKDAENVQIAQLWCGLIEIKKMINKLNDRLGYVETVLNGLFKTRDEERDKLVKSLMKF
ncbi:MAG: hypothetical protein J7J15_00480 [Candidatus Aenigmarchaeota archaeon]|nr:hypothetical protein [Candidatus Aenigmarchaeota archaeon]